MVFYRAYIVTGGTEAQRDRVIHRQIKADPLGMMTTPNNLDNTERAIAFSCEYRDFDSIGFDDIKAMVVDKAADIILPSNFTGNLFAKDKPKFGTIVINDGDYIF